MQGMNHLDKNLMKVGKFFIFQRNDPTQLWSLRSKVWDLKNLLYFSFLPFLVNVWLYILSTLFIINTVMFSLQMLPSESSSNNKEASGNKWRGSCWCTRQTDLLKMNQAFSYLVVLNLIENDKMFNELKWFYCSPDQVYK